MAKFLITVWPFSGHTHLNMAVAQALRGAGHEVSVYTGERARDLFENEGFDVFLFERVRGAFIFEALMSERVTSTTWSGMRARIAALQYWLVDSLPDQVEDIARVLDVLRPDVVVSDVTMWGVPLILRETRSLPVAVSLFMPGCIVPGPDAPPWGAGLPRPRGFGKRALATGFRLLFDLAAKRFRSRVDGIRERYGLPPLGTDVNTHLGTLPLYLVPSTPEFDFARRDLPPSVRYVGGLTWNKPSRERRREWLDELGPDRPVVHVTEGTMHAGEPIVLRAAARGLADLPLTVVMTSGGDRRPEALGLGHLARNIRLESWVSHADLLPQTDVMVTTGGGSTVVAGLAAGVPMVVVPTLWDKPDNAQRVVEAGAGIRLSPRRCNGRTLRRAVLAILEDDGYRRNARRLAGEFRRLGTARRVVELLEALVPRGAAPVAREAVSVSTTNGRAVPE